MNVHVLNFSAHTHARIVTRAGGSHAALKRSHNREACRDRFCDALRRAQHAVAVASTSGAAASSSGSTQNHLPGVPEQGSQPQLHDGRSRGAGGAGGAGAEVATGPSEAGGGAAMRDVLLLAQADVLPWLADFFSFKLLEARRSDLLIYEFLNRKA